MRACCGTEEDLPLAAALQMMHGSVLYRDIWFDKPPLVAAVYLLWGAQIGPVLRVAGAVYALHRCLLAYALAARHVDAARRVLGGGTDGVLSDVRYAFGGVAAGGGFAAAGAASGGRAAGVAEAVFLERDGRGDRIPVQYERRVRAGGVRGFRVAGA